jgi:hypothetical protein
MATTTRGYKYQVDVELVTEECINCGMAFALPSTIRDRRIQDHQSFYCPAGHPQCFTAESGEERVRRELREAEARHASQLAQERARRERAENDAMDLANKNRALKGTATKLKKRAAAGVCAFCHRTFSNVSRHVETKHPHPTAED